MGKTDLLQEDIAKVALPEVVQLGRGLLEVVAPVRVSWSWERETAWRHRLQAPSRLGGSGATDSRTMAPHYPASMSRNEPRALHLGGVNVRFGPLCRIGQNKLHGIPNFVAEHVVANHTAEIEIDVTC